MGPEAEGHLLRLLAFVLLLALSVWVGGSVAVVAIAAPTAFDPAVMPRDNAVSFGTALFPKINVMEGILGAVTILTAGLMGRAGWGTARRHRAATALAGAMTLFVLVFLFVLTPAISHHVAELKAAGVSFADTHRMPPERVALRTLHTIYGALDVVKTLAGIALIYLIATRRP